MNPENMKNKSNLNGKPPSYFDRIKGHTQILNLATLSQGIKYNLEIFSFKDHNFILFIDFFVYQKYVETTYK